MGNRKIQQVQTPLSHKYDNCEFTLATGLSDYNLRSNESVSFSAFSSYTTINIRSSRQISVKFNKTTNDAITIEANRPFELDNQVIVSDIFITNASGDTASIKIFGTRKLGEDNHAA